MRISIFTPIHRDDPSTLHRAYESLRAQRRQPDEWVILLNGEARNMDVAEFNSPWITFGLSDAEGNVGALKRRACEIATGDILVELDYDDQLTPNALEEIGNVFERDENTQFVYSNCIERNPDGTQHLHDEGFGWRHRGTILGWENTSFPALPQYLRRIEWAPNHLRAFRASAYKEVGGYDAAIALGDDHDLICRFYLEYGERGFRFINEPLYIYSRHAGNTSGITNRNAEVQAQTDLNYCRHAEGMYRRWAADNSLLCLDLGGGIDPAPGYDSVDIRSSADFMQDLDKYWIFADDSVGVLRAYHVLEHLEDPIHFFNEAYRVLAPGGFLLVEVPSTNGMGAFADPTHRSFFNKLSFEYYTNQARARFIQPQYKGRFQVARLVEYPWSDPDIPVVSAQLIALKGWYDEHWCGAKHI